MKKAWKRIFTRVLPVILSALILIVFSASAFADSGKPERDTGKPDWAGQKNDEPNKDRNQKQDRSQEREKKSYRGISTEKIALAIASVTDEETRLALSAMLDAYIAALSDKDAALAAGGGSLSELSQAASTARSALKAGLESAGFTLGSVLGWQEWKIYGNETLDLEAIELVILALDDTDGNKEALASLLSAYQSALAALETTTGEEADEQLREAANDAHDALLEALYQAGLFPLAVVEEETPPEEPLPS